MALEHDRSWGRRAWHERGLVIWSERTGRRGKLIQPLGLLEVPGPSPSGYPERIPTLGALPQETQALVSLTRSPSVKGLTPLLGIGAAQRKLPDDSDHYGPYYLRQPPEDTQVGQVALWLK
jgi:hypothetical protein